MMGFTGYILFGLIVGLAYDKLTPIPAAFIVMYALMQSSGNFGPGNMEGTISAESYPTSIRGTCYGFSAAIGKVGAAVGTQAFTPIQSECRLPLGELSSFYPCADMVSLDNLGKRYTFIIAACCGFLGVLLAFFFVEDKGMDRLEKEDENWRQYLVAHGYADIQMGDGSEGVITASGNKDNGTLEFEK